MDIVTLLVSGAVLVAVVAIKYCTDGRVEISTNDVLVATIVAVLMLFVTGRISKLIVGKEGVTVETTRAAFVAASNRQIGHQILPITPIKAGEKSRLNEISKFVEKGIQALEFQLGESSYTAFAVKRYLEVLTGHAFFRFVVILRPDRSLFGILDARNLLHILSTNNALTFDKFTSLVKRGNIADQSAIEKIAGFVPANMAISPNSDKRDALDQMERLGMDWLPVAKQGELSGIIERSRVTASLILDVADQLRANA